MPNRPIVATRCHILQLKCTKFGFGWGSSPDPAGGVYCTPQAPWGLNSKVREARTDGLEGQKRGEGRVEEGTGENGRENHTGTFFIHFEP